MDDADADQQGIWPIEVSGKATRDARTVHRTMVVMVVVVMVVAAAAAMGKVQVPLWRDYLAQ